MFFVSRHTLAASFYNGSRQACSIWTGKKVFILVMVFLGCLCGTPILSFGAPVANLGDPLFCQPQEGLGFLIVNGGSGVFTASFDCYNDNVNNDTTLSMSTTQGGTIAGTRTPTGINYVYTPPASGFTGTDAFDIPVTTAWNSAGGTGSAGGTSWPGGPTTFTVTLNVLPASATLSAISGIATPVPVPAGSISGCAANLGDSGQGPPPGAVTGCVKGVLAGSVAPVHGTLRTAGAGKLTYTSTAGFAGTDTFTYQAVGANTDGTFALNSGDVTVQVTVTKADTTTTVTSSANPSKTGQPVAFNATVTPTGGIPTGTVTFLDGGSPIGAGTLSGGIATFTTSGLAVGSHTITASYGGDGNSNGSTSSSLTQVVNKANTSTTILSSLNPQTLGSPITFTATSTLVSPGAGTLAGTFSFWDGSTRIGGPVTISNGTASFATSALALGAHSITAVYSGDGNFNGSTSSVLSQSVTGAKVTNITNLSTCPLEGFMTGWTVTFDMPVTGLGGSNFSLSSTGGITGASVVSVSGSGTTWTVITSAGTGTGTLGLDVTSTAAADPPIVNLPYTGNPITVAKRFPVADSGPDQVAAPGTTVTLNGSNSTDPDGSALTYTWVQTSGPTVKLTNAKTSIATFKAPLAGAGGATALGFMLTVKDTANLTSTAASIVNVTTLAPLSAAQAGPSQAASTGQTVTLDAGYSEVYSPYADSLATYQWKQVSGAPVTLDNSNSKTATFVVPSPSPSALVLQLWTVDKLGFESRDQIIVNTVPDYIIPMAGAGPDQMVVTGSTVLLNATNSMDPNNGILTYEWTQVDGPFVKLSNPLSPTPTFTAPSRAASLSFRVIVTNLYGQSSQAVCIVNADDGTPYSTTINNDQEVASGALVTLYNHSPSSPTGGMIGNWAENLWTVLDGPQVTLIDDSALWNSPTFIAPASSPASLLIQLTNIANSGIRTRARCLVNVSSGDTPPTASAGSNQGPVTHGTLVNLNGSGSHATTGETIAACRWTQLSGYPVTLSDPTIAEPSFVAPNPGPSGSTLVFELLVTDSLGLQAKANCTVYVGHMAPVISGPPSGPSVAKTKQAGAFTATATGSSLKYRFNWGDGTTTAWLPQGSSKHSWAYAGPYCVQAQAWDGNAMSAWSGCDTITIK